MRNKKNTEIIMSVIKILKNNKTDFFKNTLLPIEAYQKVNKQCCRIFSFEYPNMSQCSYPKMSKIRHKKLCRFPYAADPLIQELSIYYFRFNKPFFHHHNPTIRSPNLLTPNLSLPSFNFVLRKEGKFSVVDIFDPLNFL